MSDYKYNKILLCLTRLREEEKRIKLFLESLGFEVEICLDSASLPLNINRTNNCIALLRNLSQKEALKRAELLELTGVPTVNSSNSISICTNKAKQSILFEKHRIPQPSYKVAFNFEDLKKSQNYFKDGFVIKPVSSSWGRGIAKIDTKESLDAWIAARESMDVGNNHFPVLAQEYIHKGDYDIRVVIVGNKPIVAFKRVSNDSWLTNTHLGAKVEPINMNEEIQAICNKVCKILGKGIYGVDLFYDYENSLYRVCEVNHNPEFSQSWKIHGVDVAKYIASFIQDFSEILEINSFMEATDIGTENITL
jgi:RimK family alpha-L-glutamate ligase